MGDPTDFMAQTAAYGQAAQASMQNRGFQPQYASFDTGAVGAGNPLMAMASQFGEGGVMGASILQLVAMQSKPLQDAMSRLAMPAGTDLAAASRFRQFQMTSGRMGMSGTTDVYANLFGMDKNSKGYQVMSMMTPMLDQMTGGMVTKAAFMMDENLLTLQGSGSLAEVAQWRDAVGVLDPQRAGMLQQSLLNRTRRSSEGIAYDPVKDFGDPTGTKESKFRLRDQRFTAGFNNDELAAAALYAERSGMYDEDHVANLRKEGSGARRLAKAQLAKMAYKTNIDDIPDEAVTDAVMETFYRNEGAVGGASLAVRGARRIQQGLLQNASMPQLLGLMEREGYAPRNENQLKGLEDTVLQLQALGRAAAMSSEAMMKGAAAMQQQFGGSLMFNATALAIGQSSDRMFRTANGIGFQSNNLLAGLNSGRLVQEIAQTSQSEFAGMEAMLAATGKSGEYNALLKSDPSGVQAASWLRNYRDTHPEFMSDTRNLMTDPELMSIYNRKAEADRAAMGIPLETNVKVRLQGMIQDSRQRFAKVGRFNLDGQMVDTGVLAGGFDKVFEDPRLGIALANGLTGELSSAAEAELNAGLIKAGVPLTLNQIRQASAGEGSGLYEIAQRAKYVHGDAAATLSEAKRKDFVEMQKITAELQNMVPRGGTAKLVADMLDPKYDIVGALTSGEGIARTLERGGLLVPGDIAKVAATLDKLTPEQRQLMGGAITDYSKAMAAYEKTAGQDDASPARVEARAAAKAALTTLQSTGLSISGDPLATTSEKAVDATTGNTEAIKALTKMIENLIPGASAALGGGGPLATAGAPASSDTPKPKDSAPIIVNVVVTSPVADVTATATATRGAVPAGGNRSTSRGPTQTGGIL